MLMVFLLLLYLKCCKSSLRIDHGVLQRRKTDTPDGYGRFGQMNILHLLAYSNVHISIVSAFLEHIRDPSRLINQRDRYGRTPLHYDLMKSCGRNTKKFLDIGASVEVISKNEPVDRLAPILVMAIQFLLPHTAASLDNEW